MQNEKVRTSVFPVFLTKNKQKLHKEKQCDNELHVCTKQENHEVAPVQAVMGRSKFHAQLSSIAP